MALATLINAVEIVATNASCNYKISQDHRFQNLELEGISEISQTNLRKG